MKNLEITIIVEGEKVVFKTRILLSIANKLYHAGLIKYRII